jgi:hypothetical protein
MLGAGGGCFSLDNCQPYQGGHCPPLELPIDGRLGGISVRTDDVICGNSLRLWWWAVPTLQLGFCA